MDTKFASVDTKPRPFAECHRFSATCPFKDCPSFGRETFSSHQKYQQHLRQAHRNAKKHSAWKCPHPQCRKTCSSFHNFSAHVSMHRELCRPPWICMLPPGKSGMLHDPTNRSICGKRSSTKNNLIKHIRSIHKDALLEDDATGKGNNRQDTVESQSQSQSVSPSQTLTQTAPPPNIPMKSMPMAVPMHILRNLNSLPPMPLFNVPATMPMPVPLVFDPQTQPTPPIALSKSDRAAMEELALCVQAPETQPRNIDVRTVYRCIQIIKRHQSMMHSQTQTQTLPRLE